MEDFVSIIKQKLHERDVKSSHIHASIIDDYNHLFSINQRLTTQVTKLQYENEQYKSQPQQISSNIGVSKELYELQAEISKAVKEKASIETQFLKSKLEVADKDKKINELEQKIIELKSQCRSIEEINRQYGESIKKLEEVKRTMADEISANLMAYRALDTKYKTLEESNFVLKETVKKLQQALEEKKNEEFDKKFREEQQKVQKGLQEAANTSIDLKMSSSTGTVLTGLPTHAICRVDAHDGEMGCVRFSPSGQFLATSGADRKVKIWTTLGDSCEYVSTLSGCNGAVVSVDWETSGSDSLILGCSTLDSSCRIWGIPDGRLRLSLTGHTNKVVAGRFMDPMGNGMISGGRIVTGSTDRCLKLWDLRNRYCTRTMLAMSAVHDIVVAPGLSLLISGHFDRKLRLWDSRKGDLNTDQIQLPGRITGLALNPADNGMTLVACTRDPSDIQTVDLRMLRLLHSYTSSRSNNTSGVSGSLSGMISGAAGAGGSFLSLGSGGNSSGNLPNNAAQSFKPGMEFVKPCYSPDGQYVACGGHDGNIFIWNVRTGRLEKLLSKEHTSHVLAVHWNSATNALVSCERNKRVVIWGE